MVGTWSVTLPGNQDGPSPTIVSYFADGNVIVYAAAGPRPYLWQGTWIPIGPRSAAYRFVSANVDDSGVFTDNNVIEGTAEISASGAGATSDGTVTSVDQNGAATGTNPAPGLLYRLAAPSINAGTPTS